MGKTAAELRDEIEQKRTELSRDVDVIEDRIRPGRIMSRKSASVRQRVHHAKEAIMGTADDATTTVHDGMASMQDRVGEAKHEVGRTLDHVTSGAGDAIGAAADKIADAPTMVRQQTQGNPLAVGLIGFGIGLVAASLIPASRSEQQLLEQVQPQLEDSARKVAEAGQSAVQGLRSELEPDLREAIDDVKGTASASAERIVGDAKQDVQQVKAHATDAAR